MSSSTLILTQIAICADKAKASQQQGNIVDQRFYVSVANNLLEFMRIKGKEVVNG